MADNVFGRVFYDYDLDGVFGRSDEGVPNMTVRALFAGFPVQTATTAADGTYTLDMSGLANDFYEIELFSGVTDYFTNTPNPVEVDLTDPGQETVNFGITHNRVDSYPLSSWVYRLSWIPDPADPQGIQITFHHNWIPYFTCSYPGSTWLEFEFFLLAASMGKHVHSYFYGRYYEERPLLS